MEVLMKIFPINEVEAEDPEKLFNKISNEVLSFLKNNQLTPSEVISIPLNDTNICVFYYDRKGKCSKKSWRTMTVIGGELKDGKTYYINGANSLTGGEFNIRITNFPNGFLVFYYSEFNLDF